MGAVCGRPAAEPSTTPRAGGGGLSKDPPSKRDESTGAASQPTGGASLAPLKVVDLRQGGSQPREGGTSGTGTEAGSSREAASSVAASAAQQSAQQPAVSEASEALDSPKSHPIQEEEETEEIAVEVSRPPGLGPLKSSTEARCAR
jgi:hypothetical protein